MRIKFLIPVRILFITCKSRNFPLRLMQRAIYSHSVMELNSNYTSFHLKDPKAGFDPCSSAFPEADPSVCSTLTIWNSNQSFHKIKFTTYNIAIMYKTAGFASVYRKVLGSHC
jgi:hypothetical protein